VFFQLLVLASDSRLDPRQKKPYEDIWLKRGAAFELS